MRNQVDDEDYIAFKVARDRIVDRHNEVNNNRWKSLHKGEPWQDCVEEASDVLEYVRQREPLLRLCCSTVGRSRPRKTGRWRRRGSRSTRKDGSTCWSMLRSPCGGFPKLGVAFWGSSLKGLWCFGVYVRVPLFWETTMYEHYQS